MPTRPPRLCARCSQPHAGDCRPAWSTSQRRGSTRRSRKQRRRLLRDQPICAWPGCTKLATQDDHVIGWAEARRLGMTEAEWDNPDNHQGLCGPHHAEKTRAEAAQARR